jgi:hypothetical protein
MLLTGEMPFSFNAGIIGLLIFTTGDSFAHFDQTLRAVYACDFTIRPHI